MTKEQIGAVLDRVLSWPKSRQEDAARLLLAMEAEGVSAFALSDAERAEIDALLAAVDRGELASDADVEQVFARHRA
jgi:hypothetical protein